MNSIKKDQAPVMIKADVTGNIITVSTNNPEYGHIQVSQKRIIIDANGFARPKVVTALIAGTVEDLKSFGWNKDTELEGKVIVKESLKPFNAKDPERDYKIAGSTKIVCCLDGCPIYRKTIFTFNTEDKDTIIEHTNGEDIRLAYLQAKNNSTALQDLGVAVEEGLDKIN